LTGVNPTGGNEVPHTDYFQRIATGLHLFGQPDRHASSHPSSEVSAEVVDLSRLDAAQVLQRLNSSMAGLSAAEAEERLQQCGPNAVAHEPRKSMPLQLLQRLRNPLNLLLLTLAGVSLAMRDIEAAILIIIMIALSVSLAFVQERRSSRAAEALRAMVHTTATVRRRTSPEAPSAQSAAPCSTTPPGTDMQEVPIHLLVPGDVIHLSAGDMVPADVRLLFARDLFVNQAALTGESLPVEKFAAEEKDVAKDPLQLHNLCFMGTNILSGTATGVVARTGARAYFGGLADIIAAERVPTSFDQGINQFARLMIVVILVMVPIVLLVNGLTKGDWIEALLFAMAVAVGLTPEMLPMIVTVNLAKGALAMSRKKVIVKRLNGIQNFGAMDVLCADKTGTLTQDRIILQKHVNLDGEESERVLEYAYLNSYYQSGLKNLLDLAVLKYTEVHERLQPARDYRMVDEIPFDFTRRRMSVVVEGHGKHLLICKGAVEEVFAVCTQGEGGDARFDLDASHLKTLNEVSNRLNEDGFRVIAIAYKEITEGQAAYGTHDERDLVLVGYIAFLDPPKETAQQAIAALHRHGVRIKILTGDNDIVTRKVCKEVGLQADRIVLGSELEAMSADQLATVASEVDVFAKLSPTQKAAIIDALHRRGHVVGFLGDGINDGPALKAADVGVSVDTAVDIAKESADIILLEKSLLILDEGVIEGRKVFGNIVKYIRMGASSNFGNMLSVLGASAWLPFLPMTPIQVLTNNLLYDFSQTAIPTDNVDEEYLQKPRRWEIRNIARFMLFIGPISSIFDYATYFTMFYFFGANSMARAALFQTGWFVESLLSQTLIIHVIRTARIPFIESRASLPLILTSLAICAVGIWLPLSPFAGALGFTPLPHAYWPIVMLMLVAYLTLTHLMKGAFRRRFGLD
jgi:Mg2+-importing ATPase